MGKRKTTVKDALQAYLSEIGEEDLLTAEEEVQLARLIRKGDSKARDRMIKANLRLVVNIAKNYINRGLSFADFIEEGNIGLLTAVERFDPEMGNRFSTYASWWIKRSIRKALLEKVKQIRVPASLIEKIAQWKAVSSQMYEETGKHPAHEEIAERMGMSNRQLREMMRLMNTANMMAYSLSTEIVDSGTIEDDKDAIVFDDSMKQRLDEALEAINARDADILCKYYGYGDFEPMTLQKIGGEYGITRERVRQLVDRTLNNLQKVMLKDEG